MRYHYLDSLRSVLMLLGVFFHAALIFAADETWRVSNPVKSVNFDYFSSTLHIFRMPAFFIIAGFFALFSLRRASAAKFIKTRAQRLLLPFVCAFFFVNTFQTLVSRGLAIPGPLDWAQLFGGLALWQPSTKTISHLWFLPHLFAFALLLLGLARLAPRLKRSPPVKWLEWMERAFGVICERNLAVALMPLSAVAAFILKREARGLMAWDFYGMLDMDNIATYLPFFLFGALIFQSPRLYQSFFRIRPWHLAVFAAALLNVIFRDGGKQITFGNCLMAYSRGLLMWVACMFCFVLFRRFLDRPSPLFAYLSDASYSIYLFHQVFVILFGSLLLGVPLSIYLKYPIIVGASIAVALALHHFLVLRIGLLRLMFNGKWPKKPGGGGNGTGSNGGSRGQRTEAPTAAMA